MLILFDREKIEQKSSQIVLLFGDDVVIESLSSTLYFGSELKAELTVTPDIFYDFTFGNNLEYELTVQPSIDLSDRLYFGSNLSYELNVYESNEFYFGSELTYTLRIPFEGTFTFGFGATLRYHTRPEPVNLRDTKFSFGNYLHADGHIVNWNLQQDCGCDNFPINYLIFDEETVNQGIIPSSDSRIKFRATLSLRQAFVDNKFYYGSNLVLKEVFYSQYKMHFGNALSYTLQGDTTHNMCFGNIIVDGGNVILEYSDERKECNSWQFNFGSHVRYVLDFTKGFQDTFIYGSNLKADLTTFPYRPVEGRFYFGSHLTYILSGLTPFLSSRLYYGVELKSDMYMPPNIFFYFGNHLEGDIVAEYNLIFDESGCLPNEYIPVDETGFPIEGAFRSQALEEDFFSHVIRVRCY